MYAKEIGENEVPSSAYENLYLRSTALVKRGLNNFIIGYQIGLLSYVLSVNYIDNNFQVYYFETDQFTNLDGYKIGVKNVK